MGKVIKKTELHTVPVPLGMEWTGAHNRVLKKQMEARDQKRQVLELAIGMTRKIVGRTIELQPEILDAIYRKALVASQDSLPGVIRVHPVDLTLSNVKEMAMEVGFDLQEDNSVGRGGCVVVQDGIVVDSRLDTILSMMKRSLERECM